MLRKPSSNFGLSAVKDLFGDDFPPQGLHGLQQDWGHGEGRGNFWNKLKIYTLMYISRQVH